MSDIKTEVLGDKISIVSYFEQWFLKNTKLVLDFIINSRSK